MSTGSVKWNMGELLRRVPVTGAVGDNIIALQPKAFDALADDIDAKHSAVVSLQCEAEGLRQMNERHNAQFRDAYRETEVKYEDARKALYAAQKRAAELITQRIGIRTDVVPIPPIPSIEDAK